MNKEIKENRFDCYILRAEKSTPNQKNVQYVILSIAMRITRLSPNGCHVFSKSERGVIKRIHSPCVPAGNYEFIR